MDITYKVEWDAWGWGIVSIPATKLSSTLNKIIKIDFFFFFILTIQKNKIPSFLNISNCQGLDALNNYVTVLISSQGFSTYLLGKTDYYSHICISCWLSDTLTCNFFFFLHMTISSFFNSNLPCLFIENPIQYSVSEKLSFINLIDHSITVNPIRHLHISFALHFHLFQFVNSFRYVYVLAFPINVKLLKS